MQGTADEYGTLAQLDAIRRQLGARCETLIVAAAGHAPNRTHAAEVVASIASFVRGAL